MERLRGIFIFLYFLPVIALIYDIIYWVVEANIGFHALTEIWTKHHPESLEHVQAFVTTNIGKDAWLGLKKWMALPAVAALLIPPAVLHIIYTIWYAMARGKGGSYPYSRE